MFQSARWFINAFLFFILAALLIAYLFIIGTLPDQVYTPIQAEFLAYNRVRAVSQTAPTIGLTTVGGPGQAAVFSGWQNQMSAVLDARFEEQEGVTVTVYDLEFTSVYILSYSGPPATSTLEMFFPFPRNLETLHEVNFLVDGEEAIGAQYTTEGIRWQTDLTAGDTRQLSISYKADGASSFVYSLNRDRRTDLLEASITVIGVGESQLPRQALPATHRQGVNNEETFTWRYENLVANRDIRLELPTRLSFAQRVAALQDRFLALALLAPFWVSFFLVALAGLLYLGERRMSLSSYLLLGCALALFYPALTFLSGLIDVAWAAVLSVVIVSGLVYLFLTLLLGWSVVWWRAGWLLFIFLGLFSLSVLTPWRGLLMTGGGLLLVGSFMVGYARRPFPDSLAENDSHGELETEETEEPPESPLDAPIVVQPPVEETPSVEETPLVEETPSVEETLPVESRHCPRCGRALAADHDYCAGCGFDARRLQNCPACGYQQFAPPEVEPPHCLNCGQTMS